MNPHDMQNLDLALTINESTLDKVGVMENLEVNDHNIIRFNLNKEKILDFKNGD